MPARGGTQITDDHTAPDQLRGGRQLSRYLPAALLAFFGLAVFVLLGGLAGDLAADEPSPSAPSAAVSRAPDATASAPADHVSPAPTPRAGGRATVPPPSAPPATAAVEEPLPVPGPIGEARLPLVPVVGFWSTDSDISLAELGAALSRPSSLRVIVTEADLAAIEQALAISMGAHVEIGDVEEVRRGVKAGALGLLRVTDVGPEVRALSLDGLDLFGNERIASSDEWPLQVHVDSETAGAWDRAASWTLVAGGDIQLDRWMAHHVTKLEKGVDWPWDGGTVRISGRFCCSDLGHRVPVWERSGNEGALRDLFANADLAMANLEAAAVDDPRLHRLGPRFRSSLSFSGDPRLLEGLKNAGFDFLSLANNHIHNAGSDGIRDTRRHLEELEIAYAGAGRDLEEARQRAELQVNGQNVVVLACTTLGRLARSDREGAAPCSGNRLLRQISRAAEDAGVVIVFPHWGREYRSTPSAAQRQLARSWVDAGAGLVLGAHSHWVGSIEEIDDALVFYSMGNLAFDQPWSEATMQGVILELTFQRDRLQQVRLHPTLIVEDVQPNLLEHDGGGARVIRRMRDASGGLLPY